MESYITIGIKGTDEAAVKTQLESYFSSRSQTTEFHIFPKLTMNPGWIAVICGLEELDQALLEHLSKTLNTSVIGHQAVDIINLIHIATYVSGRAMDEFSIADFVVDTNLGFFDNISVEFEDMEAVSEVCNSYFSKIGFDPETKEIFDAVNAL